MERSRPASVRRGVPALTALVAALVAVAVTAAAAYAVPRGRSTYLELANFARVLTHVERIHVDPVDAGQLVDGAIHGMLRTLDPHSSYMSAEDFRIIEDDTRGRFGGVGLEVGARADALVVITPMPGTPAERAGLLPGDRILAIEGRPTSEFGIDEAVRRMRGEPGTEVTITVGRGDTPEPFDVTLAREVIRVEAVAAELIEPGFPWIRVKFFQDGAAADAGLAIERLGREGGGLRGVLLDLRRNPGGLLEEAVRLADLFLDSGVVATTRGRGGVQLAVYEARRRGTLPRVPVVVLVDEASASAAEIVAGALQDHGRAVLVGVPTFGKGSVQSLIPLGEGFGLKLTVARYHTPSGRVIQDEGIRPDVEVEPPAGKGPPRSPADRSGEEDEEEDDHQLIVGLRILEERARADGRNPGGTR